MNFRRGVYNAHTSQKFFIAVIALLTISLNLFSSQLHAFSNVFKPMGYGVLNPESC